MSIALEVSGLVLIAVLIVVALINAGEWGGHA